MSTTSPDLARYLQAQYAGYDDDLPFWIDQARGAPGPALELGCGPGRVLRALAQAGLDAHGLDHDPAMLARARRAGHPPQALHQGDLAAFDLGRSFGAILIPCNTFAMLGDERAAACLACCRNHLPAGAGLALESPQPRDRARPPSGDELLAAFVEPESGNPVQLSALQSYEPRARRLKVVWRYDELMPDGLVVRLELPTTYHLRAPAQLRSLLSSSGFEALEFFGDFDRSDFGPTSSRLLLTARAA